MGKGWIMSKYDGVTALDVVDTITRDGVRDLYRAEGKSVARVAVACAFYSDRTGRTVSQAADDCRMPRSTYGMRLNAGRAILAYGPGLTEDRAANIVSVLAHGGSGTELRKALAECSTVKAKDAVISAALKSAKDAKSATRDARPNTPDSGETPADAPTADAPTVGTAPTGNAARLATAAAALAGVNVSDATPEVIAALSTIAAHVARIAADCKITPAMLTGASA